MARTRRSLLAAAGSLLVGGQAGAIAADGGAASSLRSVNGTATPTGNGTATPSGNDTATSTGTPTDQFAVTFAVFPGNPRVGQQVLLVVALTGSSRGRVATAQWDLDGDGTFDRSGKRIEHTFDEAGWRTVTLEVRTESGETLTAERDIGVFRERTPTPTEDPSNLGTQPAGDGGDGTGDADESAGRGERVWVLGGLLALSALGWVWGR